MRDSQLYFLIGWFCLIAANLDSTTALLIGSICLFIAGFFSERGDRYDD